MIDPIDIAALVAAPFVGSFLGVVADRMPRRESVVAGRSKCRACGIALGPASLLPLLSWALQRGRCRSCGGRIDWLLPLMEIGALAIAISASTVCHGWLLWASCALGWTLLTLAAIDARWQILPDALTLTLIPAGIGAFWLIDRSNVVEHAMAAMAGFVVFAAIGWTYRRLRGRDGLGLGDAKLLAAAGAWTGFAGLPGVVLWACGTALAVVLMGVPFGATVTSDRRIAFGPYLCLGIWLVWLYGPLMLPWPVA